LIGSETPVKFSVLASLSHSEKEEVVKEFSPFAAAAAATPPRHITITPGEDLFAP